jgi:hypothetical protein
MNKKIKKKNKRFVALGVFVALLLVAVLIFFMSSEYQLTKEQSYSVEIYHSGPIAQNMEELNKEMAALLMSTKLPASSGFISPVIELHEKLNAGETSKVEIPIGGLTWLVGKCFSGFYDFESRKGDEEDMLGENGSLFSRDDYKYLSVSALANGDPAVNQVIHDVNNSTEFFVNGNLPGISSADKVVWKSLAELKKHLDSLISSGKISSETVVKIYYQGGNTESDSDRDGVLDNVDACPGVAGETACSGCICETPPEELPVDDTEILDPIPPVVTEAPKDFVLTNGVLSWTGGPEKLLFHVVTSAGSLRAVTIENGGELKLKEEEYLKLQRTISNSNKRLEYEGSDSKWVDCQIKEFSCNKVIKDE